MTAAAIRLVPDYPPPAPRLPILTEARRKPKRAWPAMTLRSRQFWESLVPRSDARPCQHFQIPRPQFPYFPVRFTTTVRPTMLNVAPRYFDACRSAVFE